MILLNVTVEEPDQCSLCFEIYCALDKLFRKYFTVLTERVDKGSISRSESELINGTARKLSKICSNNSQKEYKYTVMCGLLTSSEILLNVCDFDSIFRNKLKYLLEIVLLFF